jgi:hypothetical protein
MSRLLALLTMVAAACSSPSSRAPSTPTPTPTTAADHPLTRIQAPALSHGATPENAAGSPEATRDQAIIDALGAFRDGDTSASQCRTGGKCGVDLVDLQCDRGKLVCEARLWAEPGTQGKQLTVRDADAGKIIAALEQLDQASPNHRCDATGCKLAAISCFRDRHDEKGFGGSDADKGAITTCDDSRR